MWSLCRADGRDLPPPHRRPFQAARAQTGAKVESVPRGWPRRCCGPGCEGGPSAFPASLWSQQPMSVDGPRARNGCLFFVDTDFYQFPRRLTHRLQGRLVCLFTRLLQRYIFFSYQISMFKISHRLFPLEGGQSQTCRPKGLRGSVWGPLTNSSFPLR